MIASLTTIMKPSLIQKILKPYRARYRYLQYPVIFTNKATKYDFDFTKNENHIEASGQFKIQKSMYIKNTGHINAVELNLCYNQLAYCLLAECINRRLIIKYLNWDINKFYKYQLTNMLIANISWNFKKPIASKEFYGLIEIIDIYRKNQTIFFQTKYKFNDDLDGLAGGKCLIAVKDS